MCVMYYRTTRYSNKAILYKMNNDADEVFNSLEVKTQLSVSFTELKK
jgi:hypothetical protein